MSESRESCEPLRNQSCGVSIQVMISTVVFSLGRAPIANVGLAACAVRV